MCERMVRLAVSLLLCSQASRCLIHPPRGPPPSMDLTKLEPVKYSNTCACGQMSDTVGTRIVGGSEVTPHQFPWMMAIMYKKKIHCGGSLINDRYVLTAAHCVSWHVDREFLEIIPGIHSIPTNESTVKRFEIGDYIVYDSYNMECYHDIDDIALIKLKEATPFSFQISPVCLPEPGSKYDNRTGIVAGWGRTKQYGNWSTSLLKASVRILPQGECRAKSIGEHITDTMMCTYRLGKDACQGDSGGPLTYESHGKGVEQIGIVSWGIGCAERGVPGVYTRLTEYLTWIRYHTQDSTYCPKR